MILPLGLSVAAMLFVRVPLKGFSVWLCRSFLPPSQIVNVLKTRRIYGFISHTRAPAIIQVAPFECYEQPCFPFARSCVWKPSQFNEEEGYGIALASLYIQHGRSFNKSTSTSSSGKKQISCSEKLHA